MEQVENPMILPQEEYKTQSELDAENEALAEKSDLEWEENYDE